MCVRAHTSRMADEVDCKGSMDRAVFEAFAGRGDLLLDRLTVRTMNFSREADGTTPLMAACARGSKPLVELLLDLGCHALAKDANGWTAVEHAACSPVQQDLGKLILERVLPPLDPATGKPVHTWDTCTHAPEHRYLDESQGWLICTNCALVLNEKALLMAGEQSSESRNPWAVRGADAEYNAWRHDEMELADAMRALGVVDNEGAKRRGLETSVWKKRERALEWLDKRRRVLLSWRDRARIAQNAGTELPPMLVIPEYPAQMDAVMTDVGSAPSRRDGTTKLLNPEPLERPRFKGRKVEAAWEQEEDELFDPRAMQEALGDPFSLVSKWRRNLARWKKVGRRAVRHENYRRAGVLHAIAEETEAEYDSSLGYDSKASQVVEREMEIEFEPA